MRGGLPTGSHGRLMRAGPLPYFLRNRVSLVESAPWATTVWIRGELPEGPQPSLLNVPTASAGREDSLNASLETGGRNAPP